MVHFFSGRTARLRVEFAAPILPDVDTSWNPEKLGLKHRNAINYRVHARDPSASDRTRLRREDIDVCGCRQQTHAITPALTLGAQRHSATIPSAHGITMVLKIRRIYSLLQVEALTEQAHGTQTDDSAAQGSQHAQR